MLSSTDIALVRLYYENYGLSCKEIAALVDERPAVIDALVADHNMVEAAQTKLEEDKRSLLVTRDLDKQLTLAPIYARAELVVLHKVFEVADNISPDDPDAHQRLSTCAKALKDLKGCSVQVDIENQAKSDGIKIQILNQID